MGTKMKSTKYGRTSAKELIMKLATEYPYYH